MITLERPYTFPLSNSKEYVYADKLLRTPVKKIRMSKPFKVETFSKLVDCIARLSYFNKSYTLFFRGQNEEYPLESCLRTIYPGILRENIRNKIPLESLKKKLDFHDNELRARNHYRNPRMYGAQNIMMYKYLRWAILQHYEKCPTPFIDITRSLIVALSFALINYTKEDNNFLSKGILYVLALPWPSKHFHESKDEELVLVNMAGITPPIAKRPYRQDAFCVMHNNIENDTSKDKFDLSNRMVCKFEISNTKSFWKGDAQLFKKDHLTPKNDKFYEFMNNLKVIKSFQNQWNIKN